MTTPRKQPVREWWHELPAIGKAIFVAATAASAALGASTANGIGGDGAIIARIDALEAQVRSLAIQICLLRSEQNPAQFPPSRCAVVRDGVAG